MADKLTLDRHAMKNRATAHLRIYVGGLTESASVEELYDHFIQFGQINGIIVNRNFGFVQFEEESSAQDAISKADGSIFQGKTLSVRTAQTNPDKRRETDSVSQPELPPAVALSDNINVIEDDNDEYDNFGNYIGGDRENYREEDYDDAPAYNQDWKARGRGRGMPRGRGRGMRGRGAPGFRDRSPIPGRDRGYDRYSQKLPEYPRAVPVTERNDCEIIVVSKALTEYAEYIEGRLKHLGIVVDLLFPMEDVPIGKVLGNIASRGCLYAILVMPQNQEHRSLTLTILHGLPQEHRNMPIEDALQLISRNFQEVQRGGPSGREAVYALLGQLADGRSLTVMQYDKVIEYLQVGHIIPFISNMPIEDALQLISRNFQEVQRGGPSGREAVYALLGQLADGRSLTVMQYDKVIEYLQERREQQVKIELGEPLTTPAAPANKAQVDLQQRILSILNDKKPPPVAPPAPVPPVAQPAPAQNKLLSDPTVKKALESILQKFT